MIQFIAADPVHNIIPFKSKTAPEILQLGEIYGSFPLTRFKPFLSNNSKIILAVNLFLCNVCFSQK